MKAVVKRADKMLKDIDAVLNWHPVVDSVMNAF